jgi:nitroreductase
MGAVHTAAIDDADFPRRSNRVAQFNFLTRYAMLAPSSHNSQPWKFATKNFKLLLLADRSRRLPVADSDDRDLYISVGCALENLLVAAAHFGYACEVEYFPEPANNDLVARIGLVLSDGASLHHPELFEAITRRRTNRQPYEPVPLSRPHERQLYACCNDGDILLELSGLKEVKDGVEDLMQRASAIQFADPAYRKELARSIGRGSFGASWPAAKLGGAIVSHVNVGPAVARRDAAALRSAPLVGLLSSVTDDRISHVRVGQVFERIALTASRLSIQLQPMSQIVQVQSLRSSLASIFGSSLWAPQHLFRIGYASTVGRRTPRRRLEEAWT